MNFIVTAATDIGLTKDTNQDSIALRVANTPRGRMAFGVLCDGMGGLSMGEVASAAVIDAFDKWFRRDLPEMCGQPLEEAVIRDQWNDIIVDRNRTIKRYGARYGLKLGTTVVVVLLTQTRYYLLNVGDSRVYEISDDIRQLTNDQTFVAREIALGNMTEEEAAGDERRNVLLQCVGASDEVYPEFFSGDTNGNAVYMLCSDGFRHKITPYEIYKSFRPEALLNEHMMNSRSLELIELNKDRMESDNISVALIRTF